MQFPLLAAAFLLVAAHGVAVAQAVDGRSRLSLAEAMRLAETASPAVKLLEAEFAAAEGARTQASTLLANNPEIGIARSNTRTRLAPLPDERSSGWALGIAQPFETGGQQARRREAANAVFDVLRAEIDEARRQARADAAVRFYAILIVQRRIQIEQQAVALFESTAKAVAKRRAAGEDTRLDANVALVEAERAINALAIAREQLLEAQSELATILRLPPASLPELAEVAIVPMDETPPYRLDELLERARDLPKLRALSAREDAARARLGVERASRAPDITIGLSVGRDGPGSARDRVTTLSFSMPIPLFRRNEAAIGQAITDVSQAGITRTTVARDQEALVRRLWSRFVSQRERMKRLRLGMMPASVDNQQLAAKSRAAGQIGLLDQLIINRQAIDAERELIGVVGDFHATRVELELAAGWSPEGPAR